MSELLKIIFFLMLITYIIEHPFISFTILLGIIWIFVKINKYYENNKDDVNEERKQTIKNSLFYAESRKNNDSIENNGKFKTCSTKEKKTLSQIEENKQNIKMPEVYVEPKIVKKEESETENFKLYCNKEKDVLLKVEKENKKNENAQRIYVKPKTVKPEEIHKKNNLINENNIDKEKYVAEKVPLYLHQKGNNNKLAEKFEEMRRLGYSIWDERSKIYRTI